MDNTTVELLKGWASLIGAISWPLVSVFVLLYFRTAAQGCATG